MSTLAFTLVLKEVEPDIWLNMVVSHENLYSYDEESKDTIANSRYSSSLFKEEDSEVLESLIGVYYDMFFFFHGSISSLYARNPGMFEYVVDDFTRQWDKHYFSKEYSRNLFYNINFSGFFFCPMEKKTFLLSQLLMNSVLEKFGQLKKLATDAGRGGSALLSKTSSLGF